jgi:SAM-dependent methyltransferase
MTQAEVDDPTAFNIPEYLAGKFFARLQRLAPESVLDVGCGGGRLLHQCRDAGIPAHGVEPEPAAVDGLTDAGLAATAAAAENLPFADRSFDWVTMRHISHHLADERPAVAEAFRVCRGGVLVAEPWLDLTIPSQRVARRLDAWIEQQHTRVGQVHRVPLAAGSFLAAIPPGVEIRAEMEQVLVLRDRPDAWLRGEAEPFTAKLQPDAAAEFEAIEVAARTDGLTYNGTSILVLRRVSPHSAAPSKTTPSPSKP